VSAAGTEPAPAASTPSGGAVARARGGGRPRQLAGREARAAWLLMLPALVVLAVVALYPLGQVVSLSVTDARFATQRVERSFVGLDNYRRLLSVTLRRLPPVIDAETGLQELRDGRPRFESWVRVLPREPRRYSAVHEFTAFGSRWVLGATSPAFIRAAIDTLVFTVWSVALETILGMIIALVLSVEFVGRGLLRTAMLLPWAVVTVVSARIWEWMLQPTRVGFFNTLLYDLGLADGNIGFFQTASLQLPTMIAMDVWKTTPFMALLFLAGLAVIPQELYEAAEIDGAGSVRRFTSITLPLMAPAIAVALIFRTLDALRVFDVFQVVLGGQRYSLASYTQAVLIDQREVGLSSAASVIIFLIILVFAVSYMRMLKVDTR
jgi:trehalose/maltose transport system permease protein